MKYSKSVPVSSTLAHTKKFPHCIKWLEKHELTNQLENRVNLKWIHFILYHCHFSTVGTHISTIKTTSGVHSPQFFHLCFPRWLLAPLLPICELIHPVVKGFQCPQQQSPIFSAEDFIILKLCLTRPYFTVACWSDTKLWENHWRDATVVYDFRRKDPGWKLSGDIPSKLSWEENPTHKTSVLRENQRVLSTQRKSVEL